jgi:hypothetical protein
MAQEHINLGTPPAGVDGDTNRAAWIKAEANFTDLYSFFGGASPADILAEIEKNTSDIATLQPEVAANTSDLTTLKPEVAQNTSDLVTLKPQVAQNTSDIANIKTNTTFAGGSLTVGANALAATASVTVNAAAGQGKNIVMESAGVLRWAYGSGSAAETGSNVGSDFVINRYSDAGAFLGQPFNISRATGNLTYSGGVSVVVPVAGTALTLQNTNTNGAAIRLVGDGGTTPSKMMRARAGALEFVNDANSVIIATLADSGALNIGGTLTAPGVSSTGNVSASNSVIATSNVSAGGQLITSQNVLASGINLVLGPTGAGTVYLRPNGVGSGAGQMYVSNNGAVNVTSTGGSNGGVIINDPNGPHIKLFGQTGSYPNKWIRANGNNLEFINSAYTQVSFAINDYGTANSVTVTGGCYPASDNAWPCGSSGTRWSTIYAASGTINTCDARDKENLGPNSLGLAFVKALPVNFYRYLVGLKDPKPFVDDNGEAILDENGDFQTITTPIPGTRTHVGPMAQEVAAALTAAGVDPSTMGMWSLADPANAESRQALRENELMWVLWSAVKELAAKVEALEAATPA